MLLKQDGLDMEKHRGAWYLEDFYRNLCVTSPTLTKKTLHCLNPFCGILESTYLSEPLYNVMPLHIMYIIGSCTNIKWISKSAQFFADFKTANHYKKNFKKELRANGSVN